MAEDKKSFEQKVEQIDQKIDKNNKSIKEIEGKWII